MSKKMTRNKTYSRRKKSTQKSAPIGWLIGGIMIGLLIPGIFYLKSHGHSAPTSNSSDITLVEPDEAPPKVKRHTAKHPVAKNESSINHSHYEFYNLLSAQDENSSVNKNQEEKILHISKFQLEIGKFTDFAKADELKAQLSLIGIDNINITKSTENPHVFKVTVGPYSSRSEASKAQQLLKDNTIDSVLITG